LDETGIYGAASWSAPVQGDSRFYVVAYHNGDEECASDTAGYYRFMAFAGGEAYFSLPFSFYDDEGEETDDIEIIIGDQFAAEIQPSIAAMIYDMTDTTQYAFYLEDVGWEGPLADDGMVKTKPYAVRALPEHSTEVYLAGKVKREVLDFGIMESGEWNFLGFKEAGSIHLSDLGLIEDGFTCGYPPVGDIIWDWNDGTNAFCTGEQWYGTWIETNIGHVLVINVAAYNPPFHWIYEPPEP